MSKSTYKPQRVQIIPNKGYRGRASVPEFAFLVFETNHSIQVRTDQGDKLVLRKRNYHIKFVDS